MLGQLWRYFNFYDFVFGFLAFYSILYNKIRLSVPKTIIAFTDREGNSYCAVHFVWPSFLTPPFVTSQRQSLPSSGVDAFLFSSSLSTFKNDLII